MTMLRSGLGGRKRRRERHRVPGFEASNCKVSYLALAVKLGRVCRRKVKREG
jgi:hypothetical protein